MDIKSKEQRSKNMSKIRSKNTKPELFIRSLLHRSNFRFRVSYSKITGTPDIFFTKKKVAIFVHGCFWHRHKDCRYSYFPKSNTTFWETKFQKNILRDKEIVKLLTGENIRILIVWECTVKKMMKDKKFRTEILDVLKDFINQSVTNYIEI